METVCLRVKSKFRGKGHYHKFDFDRVLLRFSSPDINYFSFQGGGVGIKTQLT